MNDDEVEFGEQFMMRVLNVKCFSHNNKFNTLEGELIMTNFKIVFKCQDGEQSPEANSPKRIEKTNNYP